MKSIIFKILLLISLTIFSYIGIYIFYYYINTPKGSNLCYIWGDSQMCQGLDVNYLNGNNKIHYCSTAEHGAGVYDFLVFTELVPFNSNVIISIGRGVLIRGKGMDRNESAINIKALFKLKENNYTLKEIYNICRKNQQPHLFFHGEKYPLFPNEDTLKKIEPIAALEKGYSIKPNDFIDKQNLYIEGIKTLIRKNCKIIAIDFPFHPLVEDIENKSPYKVDFNQFDIEIKKCFASNIVLELKSNENIFREQNNNKNGRHISNGLVEFKSNENIFRDLTHFNIRGARLFTKKILTFLNFKEKSLLITVKHKESKTLR